MQGSFVRRSPLHLLRPPAEETIQLNPCDYKGHTHTMTNRHGPSPKKRADKASKHCDEPVVHSKKPAEALQRATFSTLSIYDTNASESSQAQELLFLQPVSLRPDNGLRCFYAPAPGTQRPAPAATCLHHVHSQLTAPAPAPSSSNLSRKCARATHRCLK